MVIPKTKHHDFEKNANSDFSSFVGMKLDKLFVDFLHFNRFNFKENFAWGVQVTAS